MKASINKDGYLLIEAQELVQSLPDDVKRTIAQYAVFEETLLQGVVDALATNTMWNDDDDPWWHDSATHNKLRMRVLALLPDITLQAVQYMEREMRAAKKAGEAWMDACWTLERDWPEGRRDERGRYGDREYEKPLTKEQAGEYLRRVEAQLAEKVQP